MEVPVLLVEFEGVLADTAALRRDALAESLAADRLSLTAELTRRIAGYGVEDSIRIAREELGAPLDHTAAELSLLRAERAFAARAGKGLRLAPGAAAVLERLTSVARLALVTRASRREVEFVLDLAGLGAMFRPIVAREDATPAKPAAAPYATALRRLGDLFPNMVPRGVAVEDSVVGVRGARAAGLLSIIVGPVPPQEAMEADAWLESLADLTPERLRSLMGPSTKGAR